METKSRLSKGILDMKFMKRTRDKIIKEEDDAEGRAMYSSEITEKMLNSNSQFIVEPSYVPCENLLDGRFSFRGMNPEIERILELEEAALRQAKEEKEKEKETVDMTDVQMSKFFLKMKKSSSELNDKSLDYGKRKKLHLPKPKNDINNPQFLKPADD